MAGEPEVRPNPVDKQEIPMIPLALFGPLSGTELLIILLIVVLLFGARRIPEIARGLGEGIRGFRSSLRGDDAESTGDKSKEASNSTEQ